MADQKAQIVLSAVDRSGAAFSSFKKNIEGLKTASEGLALKFGSIGLALTGAFEGVTLKGAIDAADQLSKLSQKTGIAIEDLSALKYAGELSDVSIEDLGTGLKKLAVNMAAAAGGSKEAAAAFDAIGVKVQAAGGGLRATDDVLGDIAEKFKGYKDGAAKAALATELFGKGGAALIPFLNAGKSGLKEMKEEAEKLGIVLGGQLGKDAEAFNDNLTRLKSAAEGAKIALAGDLLPALLDITNQFIDARKAYGGFFSGFFDVLSGSTAAGALAKTRDAIVKTRKELDDLDKTPQSGIGFLDRAQQDLKERAESKLALLEQRKTFQEIQQQRAALAAGKDVADSNPRLRGPAQLQAPIVKKPDASAAAGELALLKATLDAQTEVIKDGLSKQQDVYKFNEQFEQIVYQTGNASLKQFYEEQDAQRELNLFAQKRALAELTKVELDYQKALPNNTEGEAKRVDSQKRVAKAQSDFAKAEQDAAQAAQLASVVRKEELADQARALDVFEGNLKDLTDGARTHAGELAEIAIKVAAAKKQLIQGGISSSDADAQATALGVQLARQREFNIARDEFAKITDRAKDSEDALALVQQQNGTGLLDSEKQVTALRQQQLVQLGKVLDVTRQIAAQNPDNEALQKGLRETELAYLHLQATVDATKQRLDAAADSLGSGIADTIGRAVVEGGKLKDILNDILKQIATSVTQEAIVKPLSQQFSNFIKGSGGQGAGENLIGLLTGQSKGGANTAATTTSFTTLQTLGIDPTTAAFERLQLAMPSGGAATTTGSSDGGGLFGAIGKLFGFGGAKANVGGENIGGTTGGGTFSAASTYADGGFTGNFAASKVAGIVHGREYVMSAPAVAALGVGYLDNMHRAARAGRVRGYADGGYVGAMPRKWESQRAAPVVNIHQYFSPGTTLKTTDQAASSAGRAAARSLGRGGA